MSRNINRKLRFVVINFVLKNLVIIGLPDSLNNENEKINQFLEKKTLGSFH